MVNDKMVNNKMIKCKRGFKLRQLGDEWILIGEGIEQINFNKMITMNETAAFLWTKSVEQKGNINADLMAQWLLDEYEVSPEQARTDAQLTIDNWLEIGIAE